MLLQISSLIAALAFAVLTAYVAVTLVQIRKTASEAEQLFSHLNAELPLLLHDMRQTVSNVNAVADTARGGVERAAVFLRTVGEVGETVHQVHGIFRGPGAAVMSRLSLLKLGVRAASAVIRDRLAKPPG